MKGSPKRPPRIRNQALGEALDAWDEEDGRLTEDELEAAAAKLAAPERKVRKRQVIL